MPTYDYRCSECGHEFEVFQKMSDAAEATCPLCGGKAVRLISAGAGLLFKGDGFYITDHRGEDYRKRAKEESGAGAAGAAAAKGDAASGGAAEAAAGTAKAKGEAKAKAGGDGAAAAGGGGD